MSDWLEFTALYVVTKRNRIRFTPRTERLVFKSPEWNGATRTALKHAQIMSEHNVEQWTLATLEVDAIHEHATAPPKQEVFRL